MTIDEILQQTMVVKRHSYLRLIAKFTRRSPEEVEDILQEGYIRSWRYRSSVDDTKNVAGWLWVVIRTAAINYVTRARYHDKEYLTFDDPEKPYTHVPQYDKYFEEAFEVSDYTRAPLSQEEQKMLALHAQGYSGPEIAQLMNKPLGTVKSNICRARQKARKYRIAS